MKYLKSKVTIDVEDNVESSNVTEKLPIQNKRLTIGNE